MHVFDSNDFIGILLFTALRSMSRGEAAAQPPRVLITGSTGFLGSHCVWLLLHCGFRVRAATRNVGSAKSEELRALVASLQLDASSFELVACEDLAEGAGWPSLAAGCDYCIHTACPSAMYDMVDPSVVVTPAVVGVRSLLTVSPRGNVLPLKQQVHKATS